LYRGKDINNYFRFRAPPSARETTHSEKWSKPRRKYRKKGYNFTYTDKKNSYTHYTDLDTTVKYSWHGHQQGLLNDLFHKDGLHRRYLQIWKDSHKETIFNYEYDSDYSCDSLIANFEISGENVDLDEMLAFNTPDYKITPIEIRDPLVELSATDTNGDSLFISEYDGKLLYIDMWASWCGPCRIEMKHMKELSKVYSKSDVVFISISVDGKEKKKDWMSSIEELNMNWTNGILESGFEDKFCDTYSIIAIPRYILVDRSGNVISHNAPRPSSDLIYEWLDELIIE